MLINSCRAAVRLSPIPRIGHYALLTGNCIATNKRRCTQNPTLKYILRYFQYNILFFLLLLQHWKLLFFFQVASSIAILATVASFELLLHEQSKCFSMGDSPLSTPKGRGAEKGRETQPIVLPATLHSRVSFKCDLFALLNEKYIEYCCHWKGKLFLFFLSY